MTSIRRSKRLGTLAQVYAVIADFLGDGQNAAIKQITGASDQEVSNWKRRGWAPSNTFLQFSAALSEAGATAPRALWRMRAPARGRITSRGKRCG